MIEEFRHAIRGRQKGSSPRYISSSNGRSERINKSNGLERDVKDESEFRSQR